MENLTFPEVLTLFQIDSDEWTVSPPDRDETPIDKQVYATTKTALERAGGKWTKKGYFQFQFDPAPVVESIIQGETFNFAKDNQFFPTHPDVAELLAERALGRLGKTQKIVALEPQLGSGELVKALHKHTAGQEILIAYCEANPVLRQIGEQHLGEEPVFVGEDYLAEASRRPNTFHLILSNPPFSRGAYFDHLAASLQDLAPGGVLGIILPLNWMDATRGKPQRARDLLGLQLSESEAILGYFHSYMEDPFPWESSEDDEHYECEFYALPAQSFKHAKTSIDTCMLIIKKVSSGERNPLFEEVPSVEGVQDHKGENLPTPELIQLDLSMDVFPSPWQPRHSFPKPELEALGNNIKKYGLLQPISLHHHNGKYVLIAGERRLRAAQLVGMTHIPAQLYKGLTPTQHAAMTMAENSVRQDVDPIDEAYHIAKMNQAGTSVEEISAMLSVSKATVRRRLSICNVPARAVEAYRDNRLTLAQLEYIAPLTEHLQNLVIDMADKCSPGGPPEQMVKVKAIVRGATADLTTAPWDKTKELWGKPACQVCPHNTSSSITLFGDEEGAKCLNRSCYEHKMKNYHLYQVQQHIEQIGVPEEQIDLVGIDHHQPHPLFPDMVLISGKTIKSAGLTPKQMAVCSSTRYAYIASVQKSFFSDPRNYQAQLSATPPGSLIPYCQARSNGQACACQGEAQSDQDGEYVPTSQPIVSIDLLEQHAQRQIETSKGVGQQLRQHFHYVEEDASPLSQPLIEVVIASLICETVRGFQTDDFPQYQDLVQALEVFDNHTRTHRAAQWVAANPKRANALVRLILHKRIDYAKPTNLLTEALIGNQTLEQQAHHLSQQSAQQTQISEEELNAISKQNAVAWYQMCRWAQITDSMSGKDYLEALEQIGRRPYVLNPFRDWPVIGFLRLYQYSHLATDLEKKSIETDIQCLKSDSPFQSEIETTMLKYRPHLAKLYAYGKQLSNVAKMQ